MATLDDYLDCLSHELQASPEEADEVLREVRSHLELAVRDMGRNGANQAACLDRAIERFGPAEYVGRELRQVHGRATWPEAGLAALPLLLFGSLSCFPQVPVWIPLLALAVATAAGLRAGLPLWWWAWLGWLPSVLPGAPGDLTWGTVAYAVILLLVSRRDWLEATLAIYPLPTAWAFHRVVLASNEVRNLDCSTTTLALLSVGMSAIWAALLVRTLRTPSRRVRIARVLEGQVIIFLLNGLTIVAARLWPTYPDPYPFTLNHFLYFTLPYALYNGLPFVLFFALTSLPAILALVQRRARRRPPSRPILGG